MSGKEGSGHRDGSGHREGSSGKETSALVVFVSPGPLPADRPEDDAIEQQLSAIPTLSTGILSATQGTYKTDQLLLDITQGARVSYSAYSPAYPPALSLLVIESAPILAAHNPTDGARIGSPTRGTPYAIVRPWAAARKRAEGAPQLLRPGLLASSIPGGGAYAASSAYPGRYSLGSTHLEDIDGPLAANRSGGIAAVSLGLPSTLLTRIAALQSTHRLVVADLPAGAPGYADLRTLAATRPSGELLIVLQRAPEALKHELLWSAFAGMRGKRFRRSHDHLANHQRARHDRGNRHRPHDPRSPRSGRASRHARQARAT